MKIRSVFILISKIFILKVLWKFYYIFYESFITYFRKVLWHIFLKSFKTYFMKVLLHIIWKFYDIFYISTIHFLYSEKYQNYCLSQLESILLGELTKMSLMILHMEYYLMEINGIFFNSFACGPLCVFRLLILVIIIRAFRLCWKDLLLLCF